MRRGAHAHNEWLAGDVKVKRSHGCSNHELVVEFRAEGSVKSQHILLERGNEEDSI